MSEFVQTVREEGAVGIAHISDQWNSISSLSDEAAKQEIEIVTENPKDDIKVEEEEEEEAILDQLDAMAEQAEQYVGQKLAQLGGGIATGVTSIISNVRKRDPATSKQHLRFQI